MNFKTQVCTTREQSERLLALGLKKETADMCLDDVIEGEWLPMALPAIFGSQIPAWSLHRLVSMCDDNNFLSSNQISLYNFSTYDRAIDFVEYLISYNHFNKQYLNQKL